MLMKRKWFAIFCLLTLPLTSVNAQEDMGEGSAWYVGGSVGMHYGSMKFSDLNKDRFPSSKGMISPEYSLFVQGEFGNQRHFVVRPQLSFVTRGGKLTEVNKYDGYKDPTVDDVSYQVKAHYADLRIPILYQFGNADNGVRPYIGVTPILGFPIGGNIRLQEDYTNFTYVGHQVDLNKSNFASTYFAVAPTIGFRFNIPGGLFIGLEASYQIGLSDTYGSDEKEGKAVDVLNGTKMKFDGTRKLSGLELQLTLGIPLGGFQQSKPEVAPEVKNPRRRGFNRTRL